MKEGSQQEQLKIVAAAAHDLKTPLVFIKSAADQLQNTKLSLQQQQHNIAGIEHSADRLLRLIDSVIGTAQISQQYQLPLEPAQAQEIINDTTASIETYASELGFRIDVKMSRKLPPILTHRLSLERILFNLLDNAIKYTMDRRIVVRARQDGNRVRISVRDFGASITQTDLVKINKLIGRSPQPTKAITASSGLGLIVVSDLCRRLLADFSVKSLPRGTSFSVQLPTAHQLSLF